MEKKLIALAAVLIVFGFFMVGYAHSRNVAAIGPQTSMTGNICGPGESYFGEVSWTHSGTQRMMVAGRDGNKIFDLSKATMKGAPEANEFVTVNYEVRNGDRIVSSVTVVPWKTAGEYVGVY
jgi:hypothetical protein